MSAENTMASSIKDARVRMDAKTKAVVTELIGEDGMDAFLKSEKDDGHHNPEDYDYEKSEDQLETRFAHILADMLIAAAPEATQRTASIDSPAPVKDSSRAAAEAAAIIDKMCPFEIHSKKIADGGVGKDGGGMEYFLWKLWCVFEAAIKAVPYDNALQYELWGFLRTLKSKSRGVVMVWGGKSDLWADLPILDGVIREAYIPPELTLRGLDDSVKRGHLDRVERYQQFELYLRHWTNFSVFQARRELGKVRWILYGVSSIAEALEKPPSEQGGPKDDRTADHIPELRQACFACNVRVACYWMLIAGREIYELIIRDIDNNLEKGTATFGDETGLRIIRHNSYELYKQTRESEDEKHIKRWQFWQKRFEVLGSDDEKDPDSGKSLGLDDALRADARLAAQRMGEYAAQVEAELAEKNE